MATGTIGAESRKPADFTEAVVRSALEAMSMDLQAKVVPVTKEILSAAKPKVSDGKAEELYYFVASKEGSGLQAFADAFKQATKAAGEKKDAAALTPMLGRLAYCVISLSQPYHSDEKAYKGEQHTAFEKQLDEAAPTLKAGPKAIGKVGNPSDFALDIAKKAGEQLVKLQSPEASSGVPPSLLALAANSLASTWCAILEPAGQTAGTGSFIGNKRSRKFHLSSCRMLPAEKNRVYFQTKEQAVKESYEPCKMCKP
jgi:hypothetical protein